MRTVGLAIVIVIVLTSIVSWWMLHRAPGKQSPAESSTPQTGALAAERPEQRAADGASPAPSPAETTSRDAGSAQANAGPRMVLTINDSDEALEAYRGWPLMIDAGVFHPAAFEGGRRDVKSVKLLGQDERWPAVIRLVAKNDVGAALEWKWNLAEPRTKHSAPRPQDSHLLTWFLTGRQTADIPPGEYHLEAVLDTRRSADDDVWKGLAGSSRLIVTIRPPPEKPTAEQQIDKLRLEARLHLLQRAPERALPLVDELAKLGFDELQVHSLRAEILAAAGKTEQAMAAYEQAISAFFKRYGKKAEPPLSLLRKHAELLSTIKEFADEGIAVERADKSGDADVLTVHELRAETSAGNVAASPFPVSATKLVFRWERVASDDDAIIEARWIARSSKGADQTIATARSKKGQKSGEFSLSRPDDGFPPGRYRLELRQGDKPIHSVDFAIDKQ